MAKLDLKDFVSELRNDADAASWNLGYMKAMLDNPIVGEKLDRSYSGYAMAIANAAVKRSLALYCSRAWDTACDAVSLPNAEERLSEIADRADAVRFMIGFEKEQLAESGALIGIFRSEWLAHRVVGSRDRLKFEKQKPARDVTFNELVQRAERTVLLVGEFGYLLDRATNPYPERIERAERYCREFWRLLPVLGDAEDPSLF